jgi:hypothetical protein
MSEANLASLAFIPEVTLGTTPGTPELTAIRFTGEDLGTNKDTVQSEEIRSDRQVPFVSKVGLNPGGSFDFELSYSSQEAFIASALGNTVQAVSLLASSISFDHTANTITADAGGDFFATVRVGSLIKVADAATAGNDGLHRVIGKNATGDVLTVAAGTLTATDPADVVDITGRNITNGVLKPSFTIEKGIVNLAGNDFFQTFLGMVVDTFSLDITSKQIVTGSFDMLGTTAPAGSADTIDDSGTYTAAPTDGVINGTNNVGAINLDGAVATEKFKSLSLEVGANLRGKDAMGTEGFFDIGTGTIEVKGSLNVYFLDNNFIDKIRNHTSISLEFSLQDDAGNQIFIYLPEVKLNQGDPKIESINTDVMIETEFQAILDPVTSITIAIDFVAA